MTKLYIIILIILILLLLWFRSPLIENFLISPFNSTEVNENALEIHKKINEDKNNYSLMISNTWKEINKLKTVNNKVSSNDFIFKKLFEEIVRDELNQKIQNTKIDVSEIEEYGFYNQENFMIFNFNINLINRKQLWIIPVQVWIKLNCNNCFNILSQQIQDNLIGIEQIRTQFKLEFISLEQLKKYDVKPIQTIDNDYYQIKNTLYLMDPFLTSGDEMRLKNIDLK